MKEGAESPRLGAHTLITLYLPLQSAVSPLFRSFAVSAPLWEALESNLHGGAKLSHTFLRIAPFVSKGKSERAEKKKIICFIYDINHSVSVCVMAQVTGWQEAETTQLLEEDLK